MRGQATNYEDAYKVMRLIWMISENAQRGLAKYLIDETKQSVTPQQFAVINRLHFLGPQTASQLMHAFSVSAPSMSQMIARLRLAGLVQVATLQEDARSKSIGLTVQGTELFEAKMRALEPALRPIQEALGGTGVTRLLRDLATVQACLPIS